MNYHILDIKIHKKIIRLGIFIFWLILLLRDHFIRNTQTHSTDEMVFGDFIDNNSPRDEASRLQALRAANCIKILGKGVIRVVHRVDDARENNILGKKNIYHIGSTAFKISS